MLREPAVQGSFYPAKKTALLSQLEEFFSTIKKEPESQAIVSPHAGYPYSGRIAALAFSRLRKAKTFVILSPNHTGYGEAVAVYPGGKWINCLGEVPVNSVMARELVEKVEEARLDEVAHIQEHSIEVLLPFLQYCFKDFQILPITLAMHDLATVKKIALALKEISLKEDIALIASSDFTHFEPEENARKKDLQAIKLVTALKLEEFHAVSESGLSICGFIPIEIAMEYCRLKKIKKGELLEYDTSAAVTGDTSNVVGYAAIKFD